MGQPGLLMEPLSWVTNPPQAAADGRQEVKERKKKREYIYLIRKKKDIEIFEFILKFGKNLGVISDFVFLIPTFKEEPKLFTPAF